MVRRAIEKLKHRNETPQAIARRTRNLEQRQEEFGVGGALLHIEQGVLRLSSQRAYRKNSVAQVECGYGFDLHTNVPHLSGIPTPNIGGTIAESQTGLFNNSFIDSFALRMKEVRVMPLYSIAVTEKGELYGRYKNHRPVRLGKVRNWEDVQQKASNHASSEAHREPTVWPVREWHI